MTKKQLFFVTQFQQTHCSRHLGMPKLSETTTAVALGNLWRFTLTKRFVLYKSLTTNRKLFCTECVVMQMCDFVHELVARLFERDADLFSRMPQQVVLCPITCWRSPVSARRVRRRGTITFFTGCALELLKTSRGSSTSALQKLSGFVNSASHRPHISLTRTLTLHFNYSRISSKQFHNVNKDNNTHHDSYFDMFQFRLTHL